MEWTYVALPLVSAFIGWLTNHFAITMVFRPHTPKGLPGLRIQGLLPLRKKELAVKVASAIERELISHDDVMAGVTSDESMEKFKDYLGDRMESFLKNKLGTINPMLAAFVSDELIQKLKELFGEELDENKEQFKEMTSGQLQKHLDFQKVIEQRIDQLDLVQSEQLVRDVTARELKFIEWFGGFLGLIIVIVQVGILIVGKQ